MLHKINCSREYKVYITWVKINDNQVETSMVKNSKHHFAQHGLKKHHIYNSWQWEHDITQNKFSQESNHG